MRRISQTRDFATLPLPFDAPAAAHDLSYKKIKSKRRKHYRLILLALDKPGPLTAREVLRVLVVQGDQPPISERNQALLWLSELSKASCIETLKNLRKVGNDEPVSTWHITERGRFYLPQLEREEAEL